MARTFPCAGGCLHLPKRSDGYSTEGGHTMKLKGGIAVDRVRFTDGMREVALELMVHARNVIVLPTEAERGLRFNSNEAVFMRVESMFAESDFAIDPIGSLSAALLDAAQSDYYYAHEKDYGDECLADEDAWESDAC